LISLVQALARTNVVFERESTTEEADVVGVTAFCQLIARLRGDGADVQRLFKLVQQWIYAHYKWELNTHQDPGEMFNFLVNHFESLASSFRFLQTDHTIRECCKRSKPNEEITITNTSNAYLLNLPVGEMCSEALQRNEWTEGERSTCDCTGVTTDSATHSKTVYNAVGAQYAMICLIRRSRDGTKNLNEHPIEKQLIIDEARYDLALTVDHSGTRLDAGHWVTYQFSTDATFDDATVRAGRTGVDKTRTEVLLIYELERPGATHHRFVFVFLSLFCPFHPYFIFIHLYNY
jgi:hypothetical protein